MIIFGPTGNNGSFAARTAAELGADVVLAMRDTNKTIPGLSKAEEDAGKFKRVQADLNDPKSVEAAVSSTGAKRAFVYLTWGQPDHMKSTFQAMKSGGLEFVTFLSSFTIGDRKLEDIPQSEMIPYAHAQAEISIRDVFGQDNFVAIRPGAFAVNLLRWKQGIADGHVRIFGEHFEQDCITPIDMGTVSGHVLVNGPKNRQKHVYLYGPQIISQGDAVVKIAKALGKDVKITPLSEEEGLQMMMQHMPKPLAEYLVKATMESKTKSKEEKFCRYDEGMDNVKLYTGRPSTSFDEWLQENKGLFA